LGDELCLEERGGLLEEGLDVAGVICGEEGLAGLVARLLGGRRVLVCWGWGLIIAHKRLGELFLP